MRFLRWWAELDWATKLVLIGVIALVGFLLGSYLLGYKVIDSDKDGLGGGVLSPAGSVVGR